MEGNPLVFTQDYTQIVMERVFGIKVLDGHTVFLESNVQEMQTKNISAKLAESKKSLTALNSRATTANSIPEEYITELRPNMSIDINFRLV
jgi:hypothetical protein